MKLFIAAIYTSNYHKSCHYIQKQTYADKIRADGAKIFLDSGAFSAFTQGAEIDLHGYVDYIKRNYDILDTDDDGTALYSVLDGIGDPLKTYRNQHEMESMGVR